MPFVNVRTAKGLLNAQQKRELHHRITELLVEIEGRGDPEFRKLVLVLVEEHAAEAWSVGGSVLTAEAIDSLARSLDGGRSVER